MKDESWMARLALYLPWWDKSGNIVHLLWGWIMRLTGGEGVHWFILELGQLGIIVTSSFHCGFQSYIVVKGALKPLALQNCACAKSSLSCASPCSAAHNHWYSMCIHWLNISYRLLGSARHPKTIGSITPLVLQSHGLNNAWYPFLVATKHHRTIKPSAIHRLFPPWKPRRVCPHLLHAEPQLHDHRRGVHQKIRPRSLGVLAQGWETSKPGTWAEKVEVKSGSKTGKGWRTWERKLRQTVGKLGKSSEPELCLPKQTKKWELKQEKLTKDWTEMRGRTWRQAWNKENNANMFWTLT